MRKSALAEYVETGRCPVTSAKAGHTGGPAPCPACEQYLRNPQIRNDVDVIVARRRSRSPQRPPAEIVPQPRSVDQPQPRHAPLTLGPGEPVERDGTIWWFDRAPSGRYVIYLWEDGIGHTTEWSKSDGREPPAEIKDGFAVAEDADSS